MRAAVGIPVGPGDYELERLADALESIRAHVPEVVKVLVIDDDPERTALEPAARYESDWVTVFRRPPGPRSPIPNDRMTASSLCMLRWLADGEADYLVKLDTDALVIADFRPSLERAIRARPQVGMWGAHRENEPDGTARDFSEVARPIALACLPVRPALRPLRLQHSLAGRRAATRRFVRDALRSARRYGYELGEHCLGGSYAVTGAAAAELLRRGYLDSPYSTYGTAISEDAVVALLVRAAGFECCSLVAPGEAFGIKHIGLLAEPEELARRGHAIVHSVKGSGKRDERQLRARFRALRTEQGGVR